jgi:hypothetical protein
MLRDIRDLTDEREAYADELRQGISSHVMFLARGKAAGAITSGSYLSRTETVR